MTSESETLTTTETPTPTPTKITADKPVKIKDPKKVAQGKKLAEISKQAKERKMREAIQQEMLENSGSKIPFGYIVGTVGLAIVAGALYYGYNPNKIVKSTPLAPDPTPTPAKPAPKSNLDSFD